MIVDRLTVSQFEALERMLFDFAALNGNILLSTRREMQVGKMVIHIPGHEDYRKVEKFIMAVVTDDDICPTAEIRKDWNKRHAVSTFRDGRPMRRIDMDSTDVEKPKE